MRPRRWICTLAAACVPLVLAGCGAASAPVSTGAAGQATPGSAPPVIETKPVPVPGTVPTTLEVDREGPPVLTLNEARPRIEEGLQDRGLTEAHSTCVIDVVSERFSGPQLAYVVGILSLKEPTDESVKDVVKRSGVNLEVDFDLPDQISMIIDLCRPKPTGTTP